MPPDAPSHTHASFCMRRRMSALEAWHPLIMIMLHSTLRHSAFPLLESTVKKKQGDRTRPGDSETGHDTQAYSSVEFQVESLR